MGSAAAADPAAADAAAAADTDVAALPAVSHNHPTCLFISRSKNPAHTCCCFFGHTGHCLCSQARECHRLYHSCSQARKYRCLPAHKLERYRLYHIRLLIVTAVV